jgi:hypothetical protein
MAEPLLWSADDLAVRAHAASAEVRRWALERLQDLYPDRALDVALGVLDDPEDAVAQSAMRILGASEDADRFGPPLLARWSTVSGSRFSTLASTLGLLRYLEALPMFEQYLIDLRDKRRKADLDEGYGIIAGLGAMHDAKARALLWVMTLGMPTKDALQLGIFKQILLSADDDDLVNLVPQSHEWAADLLEKGEIPPYAVAINAGRLDDAMRAVLRQGELTGALEHAGWQMGREPAFSVEFIQALEAMWVSPEGEPIFPIRDEAMRLIEERGHPVDAWRADWEASYTVTDYRRIVLVTARVLDLLAAAPSPHPAQRRSEAIAALAMLCLLQISQPDEAWLAADADPTTAVLAALVDPRKVVLSDVVERVVALGPTIVPRLLPLVNSHDEGWGIIRVIDVITLLAHEYPGSCDVAIPALIACIHDEQGDFAADAAQRALIAIGPLVVEPVAVTLLSTEDTTQQIYLASILGHVSTAKSTQALLTRYQQEGYADEILRSAIESNGSALFLEPLKAGWDSHDQATARTLIHLTDVNELDDPDRPVWDATINLFKSQWERARQQVFRGIDEPHFSSAAPELPLMMSKKKAVSSKEKQRRKADRKQNRKKR